MYANYIKEYEKYKKNSK